MGDNMDELSSLESKHRKEKKELQGKIQALKKAAKNDKTKKKELTSEIARLESELEIKHKQEIEDFMADHEHEDAEVEKDIETEPKIKLTKAQKRRDKKSQQEKEREEQIKLQEKENVHGPRNTETQTITTKLKENNLKIYSIPSDGDCLYKAISHQLSTARHKHISVYDLRCQVSQHILQNKDDFFPFMSHPETCEMLTEAEFEDYCEKIKNTKVWGGQLEIRAMSNILKCPINVIQATAPGCIEQGTEFEGPPLIITYHRHMYQLGEHYNSTIVCDDEEDKEEE